MFGSKLIKNRKARDEKNLHERELRNEIDSYIKDIASILKIDVPEIIFVDYLFSSFYIKNHRFDESHILGINSPYEKEIPDDAHFIGGYYNESNGSIVISNTFQTIDSLLEENMVVYKKFGETYLVESSLQEIVFTIAHELRHLWQKVYEKQKYFENNAINLEVLNDPSEIDADAFAIAYMYSDKTSFIRKDFPLHDAEMRLQGMLDKGARWKRAEQLAKEYNFAGTEKIKLASKDCSAIGKI